MQLLNKRLVYNNILKRRVCLFVINKVLKLLETDYDEPLYEDWNLRSVRMQLLNKRLIFNNILKRRVSFFVIFDYSSFRTLGTDNDEPLHEY